MKLLKRFSIVLTLLMAAAAVRAQEWKAPTAMKKLPNGLTVVVSDSRAAQSFELTAHPENALDVFHHPYAYAALQGVI